MAERAANTNAERLDDFRQGRFLLNQDQNLQALRGRQQTADQTSRRSEVRNTQPRSNMLASRTPQSFVRQPNASKQESPGQLRRGDIVRHAGTEQEFNDFSGSENAPTLNQYGFNRELDRKQKLEEARNQSNQQAMPDPGDEKRQQLAQNLKEARNAMKNAAHAASPKGALQLMRNVHLLADMPYVAAFGAALLKDLLDFGFIGSLPLIGTVLTICASIFIFMMLLLSGSSGARSKTKGMLKKMLTLGGGTIVETFFGINFLPVEVLTVALIYYFELSGRMQQEINLTENDEDENEDA